MTDPHLVGVLRSLAYHRRLVSRLDDAMVARALARCRRWSGTHAAGPLLERWIQLLEGDPADLRATMTSDSEAARQLRSVTPFAGELPPKERWALWREVRERA